MDVLINLFVNGISTGMLIFLLASGLSLIFGLMSVLNFAHGGLFAWGAYSGLWIYQQTGSFVIGIIGAIMTGFILGILTEKWIIKPVYDYADNFESDQAKVIKGDKTFFIDKMNNIVKE